MPTVLLIRHAQASYGSADYDVLSPRGDEQVDALWRALKRRRISADVIVTGSLRRQRDTARHWAQLTGSAPTVDPRWNEYDDDDVLSHHSSNAARIQRSSGDARPEMTSRDFQVVVDEALRDWVAAGAASGCVQTWPQFRARVDQGLDDVASRLSAGQTALVFSSSGVISALAASLIGAAEAAFVPLNRVSVNTAITKIIVGRRGRTLVTYNDHSHLEEAGESLLSYR